MFHVCHGFHVCSLRGFQFASGLSVEFVLDHMV